MTEDIADLSPFFEDRCWMFVHLARQACVGVADGRHLGRKHKKTGQICLGEKPSVSDLESSSLAGFFRGYSVQSVHAPLAHRFQISYACAGIRIGRINGHVGKLSWSNS